MGIMSKCTLETQRQGMLKLHAHPLVPSLSETFNLSNSVPYS